jgi:TPR repeat protein
LVAPTTRGCGNLKGQYLYGQCLLRGEGVEKNPGKAASWFRKSANQGMGGLGLITYYS